MKHRIGMNAEQKHDLRQYMLNKGSSTDLAEEWLNANLPHILKTEPLVVTDEMAEEFLIGNNKRLRETADILCLCYQKSLQSFADRYINSPAEAAPADKVPRPTAEADELREMRKRAKVAERELELARKDTAAWKNTAEMHHKELEALRQKQKFQEGDLVLWQGQEVTIRRALEDDYYDIEGVFASYPASEFQLIKPAAECFLEVAHKQLTEARAKVAELEADLQNQTNLRQTYELACAEWEKATKTIKVRLEMASPARLLPIVADMPPVPEGCERKFVDKCPLSGLRLSTLRHDTDTHYIDIQLPEPPPQPDPLEQERKEFEELFTHSEHMQALRKILTNEQFETAFSNFCAARNKA